MLIITSCAKKTCTETNAPNFGQDAPCTDLTSGMVGTYIGTFADSSIGISGQVTPNQTVTVSKIDDATIQFTPSDNTYVPFVAKLSQNGTVGITLSIKAGTYNSYQYSGLAYTGSSSVNGAYDPNSKQLATYITITDSSGSTLEIFAGTKQ
jgi:hypothetical protein